MGAKKEIRSTEAAKILPESMFHSFLYSTSDIVSNVCSSSMLQLQSLSTSTNVERIMICHPLTGIGKYLVHMFIPIMTDKYVALKALLEVIRCYCKAGGSTMRRSCCKADLHYFPACGEYRGVYINMSVDQEDSYMITRQISRIYFVNSKRRHLQIHLIYDQCIVTQN